VSTPVRPFGFLNEKLTRLPDSISKVTSTLNTLPPELHLELFKYLDAGASVYLGLTCKKMYSINYGLHGRVNCTLLRIRERVTFMRGREKLRMLREGPTILSTCSRLGWLLESMRTCRSCSCSKENSVSNFKMSFVPKDTQRWRSARSGRRMMTSLL
jgi:hypothetical protein